MMQRFEKILSVTGDALALLAILAVFVFALVAGG